MSQRSTSIPDQLRAAYKGLGVRGKVVLGVSGGADSMALLRGTLEVARELEIAAVVAHLDHSLREESAADADWVRGQADGQGVACSIGRRDVRSAASLAGRGLEETARRDRYGFLSRVAEGCDAAFVATAHTRDDQTETVLFQLLRGSGLRGLRGVAPRRRLSAKVTLVRPLLESGRVDVERYLASLGQPYLTDASNSDLAFTRNRLRRDLLPRLREAINPRIDAALWRLSTQAAEASRAIEVAARKELRLAAEELTAEVIRLSCGRLRRRPRAVVRETVVLAWRRAGWPRQAMGFAHWDAVAGLVIDGGRRSLPGGADARRRGGELILRRPSR